MPCDTSEVTLGGITFDLDPEDYTPLSGTRRGSVHRLVDNRTVVQDRGFWEGDGTISLSGRLIEEDTVKSLWELYVNQDEPMEFEDFKGGKYMVLFTPGVESFRLTPILGSNSGWEYTMELTVVSVVYIFNGSSPYI